MAKAYVLSLSCTQLDAVEYISCSHAAGRQASDIVNWLKKKTGPPAVELKTVDEAKTFAEKEEVVVIGFFKVICTTAPSVSMLQTNNSFECLYASENSINYCIQVLYCKCCIT